MQWITEQRLQREFGLPRVQASEIAAEQLRSALLHRWQPWVWLACWAVPVLACWLGWLWWDFGVRAPIAALWLMIVAVNGWAVIGHWLAGSAMLTAAAARARRLQRAGEDCAPQENATSNTASSAAPPIERLRP